MSIPSHIKKLVEKQPGSVTRKSDDMARKELARLGIREGSELHTFLLSYCPINFFSNVSYETLCDITEPSPEMAMGTEFIREVWELPEEYICLTSCEGEGAYLYSKKSEAIFDFDLAGRKAFVANPKARWQSFYQFLEWYLGEGPPTNQ